MNNLTRRTLLIGAGGLAGWSATAAFRSHLPVYDGTRSIAPESTAEIVLNDASELSATPIHKHIIIKEDPGAALVDAVRAEMKAAEADGRPFNIGAARHSMGGHAIPRDGHAITFDNGSIEPDSASGIYKVHAGARWSQVIAALDPLGFSPKVMQSNNDFGVASTFCVNAHGWPVPFGPMGATVRSCRMILPSGELVTCSPTQNTALFGHAMGGYGLTGAIVDLEVEMARNSRLVPSFEVMPATAFAARFDAAVNDPAVTMAYGRLNVDRSSFFSEALLITYRETEDQSDLPAASGSGAMSHLASRVYRGQLGNERMKAFRWWSETVAFTAIGDGPVTRNSLINEPVVTLDDRNPDRTDILHEYFIGFDRFNDFLTACQEVIPASYQEFLNVTLRFVNTDAQSTLSYATVPRIAAVMSFSQELTARAEADMQRMTRALIDRVTGMGGAYYLPYRPHPTVDQLVATYPNAPAFAAMKRELDPKLTLRNNFWDTYLDAL
ncbi:FAD-binding protein [Roseobacter sp. YSTF-M11]|uniref:FAD-binding protein n=1 Tax=Roseobacter insulae TaxID=2859783 RepID=A0A9X1FXK4_9RHOB|nr:FAD-binding protein [Roseobacter insulae]MBW4709955.1 FAD-binding protein [Roseobacter insulae]